MSIARSCGEDASAVPTLHADLPRGTLAAARSEDKRARAYLLDAVPRNHGQQGLLLVVSILTDKREVQTVTPLSGNVQ